MADTTTVATLTSEERAQMEEWLAAHPNGDQDDNGIDLASLRRNLRLTPTERLYRLQTAVDQYWEIRRHATYSR